MGPEERAVIQFLIKHGFEIVIVHDSYIVKRGTLTTPLENLQHLNTFASDWGYTEGVVPRETPHA